MNVSLGRLFASSAMVFSLVLGATHENAYGERAKHVVVVGIDGIQGTAVEKADVPNMRKLIEEGAYTLVAEAVMPSVSAPNWAAILMGSAPRTNGVTSNEWLKKDAPIFPTIFQALHAKRPEAFIGTLYEWGDFGKLFRHSDVSLAKDAKACEEGKPSGQPAAQYVASATADLIRAQKPVLTFVHLDLIDHAGHANTYGSKLYLEAVGEADRYVGEIVDAIHDAGISRETVILVLGDHGGKGTGHGGGSKEERLVPWIIAGPGIAHGKKLPEGISLTQTAPTLARILHIKAPKEWTAKPVKAAFGK